MWFKTQTPRGLLVVSYTDGQQFTVQKLDQVYVLVSSSYKTIHHDMTYTLLKARLKTQINNLKVCTTFCSPVLYWHEFESRTSLLCAFEQDHVSYVTYKSHWL